MASIYDKLLYLNETKGLIREAIEDQDVEVPQDTPFREYAEKIAQIKGKVWSVNGKTGDVTITLEELGGLSEEELLKLLEKYVKEENLTSITTNEINNIANSTI